MNIIRHIIHAFVAVSIAMGVAVTVSTAADYIAEQQRRESAVVNDWQTLNWRRTATGLAVDVYGTKNLECVFVSDFEISAVAFVDGVAVEVKVRFLNDETPGSTRPVGAQSFGVWEFSAPSGHDIQRGLIVIPVAHLCPSTDGGPVVPVISSIELNYN